MTNGADDDEDRLAMEEKIPEKSRTRYKKCLKEFRNWMEANGQAAVYLKHKSLTLAPNSLFSFQKKSTTS